MAKRVATETSINEKRVSIASVAVTDFARNVFERFDDKQILVIGAGETAEETLVYLQAEGAQQMTIVNRSARGRRRSGRAISAAMPMHGNNWTHVWSKPISSSARPAPRSRL